MRYRNERYALGLVRELRMDTHFGQDRFDVHLVMAGVGGVPSPGIGDSFVMGKRRWAASCSCMGILRDLRKTS
jgi:hypothetical protein